MSDTPSSGRLSEFDEHRLKTLIHNYPRQCTRELSNVMNCDHPPTCGICIQWARFKIECMGTACSKPKSQKSAGGHMWISVYSSSIGF